MPEDGPGNRNMYHALVKLIEKLVKFALQVNEFQPFVPQVWITWVKNGLLKWPTLSGFLANLKEEWAHCGNG